MSTSHFFAVLAVALLLTAGVRAEEVERPAWMSEEVMRAAMNIGMTEDQLGPFRENVRIFLEDYRDTARRIIRRGDAGIESSVHRARNSLAREMDERMVQVLTEAQMTPYQEYRAALLDALTPQ